MKALKILSIIALSLLSNLVVGQDTIYVYKKVGGILKIPTNNVDSIIFYDTTSIAVDTTTSITDEDGNVYTSVTIGTQEWMIENLKTTKYSDGTAIPNVTGNAEWYDLNTGAWSHYDNDNKYDTIYGKLYNWYAVETGKLCPTGWHVPTDAEWTVLTGYLAADGHSAATGNALKSTSGWGSGNGTDDYGWLGLPGGYRYGSNGDFDGIGVGGLWWSSSQYSTGFAWYRYLSYGNDSVSSYHYDKRSGFSVRCLRD
jgi:uncharacterized protein (TIGR02145 family)